LARNSAGIAEFAQNRRPKLVIESGLSFGVM